jgi:hypothetical protein
MCSSRYEVAAALLRHADKQPRPPLRPWGDERRRGDDCGRTFPRLKGAGPEHGVDQVCDLAGALRSPFQVKTPPRPCGSIAGRFQIHITAHIG